MAKRQLQTAAPLIPAKATLPALRMAAAGCKACDLWKLGTQTVFGEGGGNARVMLVGEQPGDKEDIQGRPFVGPAGAVLDKALAAAGQATKLSPDTGVQYFSARAYIDVGQLKNALSIATQLERSLESDPQAYGKLIEAEVQINGNDPRAAIRLIQESRRLADTWMVRLDEARASYKLASEKAGPRNPVKNIADTKLNALGGAQ